MNRLDNSPQQILKTFKEILKEAADVYEKPLAKITELEFSAVSNGRLGVKRLVRCGGFRKLREYVAPGKKNPSTVEFIKRVISRA